MESTTSSWRLTLARAGGFLAGAALVVVALAAWQIPRGGGWAGSDVLVIAQASGELDTAPTGAIVTAVGLAPGHHASGGFGVRNQTGKALRVRLRALPDSRELDTVLHIEVLAGGHLLYRGALGGLRRWTARAFVLPLGGRESLSARIWIPADTRSGYQGQSESVPLELESAPLEASGA